MRPSLPQSYALIGEIIRASEGLEGASAGKRRDWWEKANLRFGSRLDYLLWRSLWAHEPVWPEAYPPQAIPWAEVIRRLKSEAEASSWGITVLLPKLLEAAAEDDPESGLLLARASLEQSAKLPFLDCAKTSCAIARLLATESAHRLLNENIPADRREEVTISAVRRVREGLRTISPDWLPRRYPDLHGLEGESDLLPFAAPAAFGWIYSILKRLVIYGSETSQSELDLTRAVSVAGRLSTLAVTAWQCCRMHRLLCAGAKHNGKFIAAAGWEAPSLSGRSEEYRALLGAANIFLVTGDILQAATFAHIAFRIAPKVDGDTMRQATFWGKWIHQCGLEIDKRFKKDTAFNPRKAARQATNPPVFSPTGKTFWRRIRYEQEHSADWQQLLGTYGEWQHLVQEIAAGWKKNDPLEAKPNWLLTCLAHHAAEIASEATRAALFRLCVRYSLLSLAAKVIRCLPEEDRHCTLRFARAVKIAQSALPLGLDEDQHDVFRSAVRARFARQADSAPWNHEEVLSIHELLLGRSLVNLRSAAPLATPTLAAKFNYLVTEEEVRRVLAKRSVSWRRGAGEVSARDFEQFAESYRRNSGSPAFFLSVVPIDDDRFSVLAMNGLQWSHSIVRFAAFARHVAAVRETLYVALSTADFVVPWGESFADFASELAAIVAKFGPVENGSLLISTSAELAEIPWQDLVRRFWFSRTQYPTVSLIPSFSWAALAWPRPIRLPPQRLKVVVSTDNDFFGVEYNDLRRILYSLRTTEGQVWNGLAVVAGHGRLDAANRPVVEGCGSRGGPLQQKEWFEYGEYLIVVLHACTSGRVFPGFLADLGGIPGLVLGMNCRLVCAPVAEVPAVSALLFQQCLRNSRLPVAFGARYATAVREDARVACYNLYGFPTEWIEQYLPRALD